jgi:hypothetical protein
MVISYRFCCEALLSDTHTDMLASCDGSMFLANAVVHREVNLYELGLVEGDSFRALR